MADAELETQAPEAANPEGEAPAPKPKKGKKKKKRSKFPLILLILICGAAAGLQLSGGMDFRPTVYSIVPRIPYLGPKLAELLSVPPIYSLTPAERRRIELDEWEASIAERKRMLDEQEGTLNTLSGDLYSRSAEIDATAAELAARLEALGDDKARKRGGSAGDGSTEEETEAVIRTFSEMSPKNAAAILEKFPPELGVTVLNGLDENFRARTLAKMDAARAAVLMEMLTEMQEMSAEE